MAHFLKPLTGERETDGPTDGRTHQPNALFSSFSVGEEEEEEEKRGEEEGFPEFFFFFSPLLHSQSLVPLSFPLLLLFSSIPSSSSSSSSPLSLSFLPRVAASKEKESEEGRRGERGGSRHSVVALFSPSFCSLLPSPPPLLLPSLKWSSIVCSVG